MSSQLEHLLGGSPTEGVQYSTAAFNPPGIRSHSSLWENSEAQTSTPKEKGAQAGWHRQVVVLGARGVGT